MDPDRLYITLDTDWADDEVLTFVLDLLDEFDCRATFFITHRSPVIEQMESDPRLERGIHPNFTSLLGDTPQYNSGRSAAQLLDDLLDIVPEARACRAHSLITGTPLLRLARERGLLIDSNAYVPWRGPAVRPWRFWTGTLIVPFVWSDYIDLLHHGDDRPDEILAAGATLKVVAFHPIHVYLNTVNLDHYAQFRDSGLSARAAQRELRRDGPGAGDVLRRLVEAARERRITTGLLSEFLETRDGDATATGRG